MATDRSWDEPPATEQSRVGGKSKQLPQLRDLLRGIPHDLLNEQCSKRFLAKVAKHLTNWRLLCPYLEMSDSDEDDIMETYQGNELRKQKLLLRWRERFGKKATHSVLIRAIFDMGNIDLAHEVCQMLKESGVEVAHTPSSSLMGVSIPPPAMAVPSTSASSLATATPPPVMAITAPSPVIPSYRDQLKHGYATHKPVMVMEWPPPPALKYITLAMIKKKTVEKGSISDEYIRTTIHGDMQDILHKEVPVEVDQLFSMGSDKHKVILIEGAPGSGKSTLLWHICQKWQSGELFQQFTLVLLVLLRDTHVRTSQCLADILPCVPSRSSKYTPSEYRKAIASDIEDRHGEGVLIMLDGWDEAPTNLQQEGSLIHDIIAYPSKCSVQKAAVVVSSRPSASRDIRKYASTRVEVLGFTRERRDEYVRESLQDNPEAAHSLLQQIESDLQLSANCQLPLNLVIITHTFMCSGNTLPSTYCRIIINLVQSCLLRHIQKSTLHGTSIQSLESFGDLPDGVREEFFKLCELAYQGVVKKKYSFLSEDLREITQVSGTGAPQIMTLGLLQAVHSLVATGSSTVYHFLHLSLQELCAAYHIASLPSPETEHVRALKRMMIAVVDPIDDEVSYIQTHFQPVCKFYSALTHLRNPQVVSKLLDVYEKRDYGRPCFWFRNTHLVKCHHASLKDESFFECLLEADNPGLTAEMIGTWVKIEYPDIGRALALAIEQAPHLESVSCQGFSSAIGKALLGKTSLSHLHIWIPTISLSIPFDVECVKHVLVNCTNLEQFSIHGILGDAKFSHLAEILNQTSIQTLQLSNSYPREAGLVAFSSTLATNTTIQHLTLDSIFVVESSTNEADITALSSALKSNTTIQHLTIRCEYGIGEAGIIALSSALKTNTTIQHLTIGSEYGIGEAGIIALSTALKTNTTIQHLTVSAKEYFLEAMLGKKERPKQFLRVEGCGVGDEGMVALASAISTNTTLKCLNASGNKFGDKGAFGLAKALSHTSLQKVDISYCGIKEDGMTALSSVLSTTMIRCLYVYGNNFGDKGASHLAEALSHTSLQEINISYCGIGEDGMEAISSALKTSTTLKCLYVYRNNFGDKGASHLAEALSHTSLQKVDISYCGIGEDGMVALSSSLKTNTTLKHLDISRNQYRDEGIIALSSALSTNTTLKHLNVSLKISDHSEQAHDSWKISGYSRVALARAILQNTSLASLKTSKWPHLFTCEVTQTLLKDTNAFYTSIKRSPIIRCISIDKNSSLGEALWSGNMEVAGDILELNLPPAVEKTLHIQLRNNTWEVDYGTKKVLETDEGLLEIRSIYNDPTSWGNLHELTLDHMFVGSVGACLLAEILNETQIQKLSVHHCHIPEDGIVALSQALSTNTTLKYLAIGGNCINKCGQEALARALTSNTTLAVLDVSVHRLQSRLKSFDDIGQLFFQHVNQFSLSTIVNDGYTPLGKHYKAWHRKIMNWKTFKTTLLPTHNPW